MQHQTVKFKLPFTKASPKLRIPYVTKERCVPSYLVPLNNVLILFINHVRLYIILLKSYLNIETEECYFVLKCMLQASVFKKTSNSVRSSLYLVNTSSSLGTTAWIFQVFDKAANGGTLTQHNVAEQTSYSQLLKYVFLLWDERWHKTGFLGTLFTIEVSVERCQRCLYQKSFIHGIAAIKA